MLKVHLNKTRSSKNRAVYSVLTRGPKGWRLSHHTSNLTLEGATFKVQKGGSKRAKATSTRNVHAFVSGTPSELSLSGDLRRVTYHPFRDNHFTDAETGSQIFSAPLVALRPDGVWIEA